MQRTVIYGGPGAGKTRKLLELILSLIRGSAELHRVSFVSFTRAAVREMQRRVYDATGVGNEERGALPGFHTVHSHCFRLLGLKSEDVANFSHRVVFAEAHSYDITKRQDVDPEELDMMDLMDVRREKLGDVLFYIHDQCRARMLDPVRDMHRVDVPRRWMGDITPVLMEKFTREWEAYKLGEWREYYEVYSHGRRLYDFMDMVEETVRNNLRIDFPIQANDEFQDTFPLIYQAIRNWYSAPGVEQLLIAGDPDQSIYAFAGASPMFFLQELKRADTVIALTKSHRNKSRILDFAYSLLTHVPPEQRSGWQMEPAGEGGEVSWLNNADGEYIALLAHELASKGDTVYILTRTNREWLEIASTMDRLAVPHVYLHAGNSAWAGMDGYIEIVDAFYNERFPLRASDLRRLLNDIQVSRVPDPGLFRYGMKTHLLERTGYIMDSEEVYSCFWLPPPQQREEPGSHTILRALLRMSQGANSRRRRVVASFLKNGRFMMPYPPSHIRIGTIFAAKGWECDSCVLKCYTPAPVLDRMVMDRGVMYDEMRLYFVGATRPRDKLYLVDPEAVPFVWGAWQRYVMKYGSRVHL